MTYCGYKIEKGRGGWDIYRRGKYLHTTDNQTQAMEWCDEQIDLRRKINAA